MNEQQFGTPPEQNPPGHAELLVLRAIHEQLASLLADFDPATLDDTVAVEITNQAASLQKLCAAVGALAGERASKGDAWRAKGDHSSAAWLAKSFGCTVAQAGGVMEAVGRLDQQPAVARALRSGGISPEQFRIISEAVAEAPSCESTLLQAARHESLFRLSNQAAAARAAAVGDDEQRHRRAHQRRSAKAHINRFGEFELGATNTASAGARFMQALRLCREEIFRQNRSEGTKEPLEALDADALMMMAEIVLGSRSAPKVGGGAAKVIVRVDYEALMRGRVLEGEVCELSGLGPIPVSAAREITQESDTFLAAALTKGERVAGVTHFGRDPNTKQRTALEWLHPTCVVRGCDNSILQWDHEQNYEHVRSTELENMEGMCGPDHRLKTEHGWRLEEGTGRRRLLPPGHPDHPGSQDETRPNRSAPARAGSAPSSGSAPPTRPTPTRPTPTRSTPARSTPSFGETFTEQETSTDEAWAEAS